MSNDCTGWSTFRELDYLKGLGSWVPEENRPKEPDRRRRLLIAYRDSMDKRTWGRIDRCRIEQYLCEELFGKKC